MNTRRMERKGTPPASQSLALLVQVQDRLLCISQLPQKLTVLYRQLGLESLKGGRELNELPSDDERVLLTAWCY